MKGKLNGKVALVTDASNGVGRGVTIGLAAAGARVAVNYKTDAAGAEATRQRTGERGGESEAVQADTGSKADFEWVEMLRSGLLLPHLGAIFMKFRGPRPYMIGLKDC